MLNWSQNIISLALHEEWKQKETASFVCSKKKSSKNVMFWKINQCRNITFVAY